MNAEFGEFFALLLRNHGYTQQGMIDWLLENQRPPGKRFKTSYAIKEYLRVNKGELAHDHPLVFEIARFFESKRKFGAASRIRHIYQQQAYDTGEYNGLHAGSTIHSKGIDWMVFPDVDRAITLQKKEAWLVALNDGDRRLLRESISFYFDYKDSYVHSFIRQVLAVDLARTAISNAEYTEGYVIVTAFIFKWKQFMDDFKNREYKPLMGDLFEYLTALQTKAEAASYIYYFAPFSSSRSLFLEAQSELRAHKRFFVKNLGVYEALTINLYVRLLGTLCRSLLSLSQTGKDSATVQIVTRRIKKNLKKLEKLTVAKEMWDSGRHVDEFDVRHTICRARALIAGSEAEIEEARSTVQNYLDSNTLPKNAVTRYRVAKSLAILSIGKYRVALSQNDEIHTRETLSEAGKSILSVMDTVEPPKQYHVRLTVKSLVCYLQALRIVDLARLTDRSIEQDAAYCDGLSIFEERRNLPKIKEELLNWDSLAREKAGIMFEVDPDSAESIQCLVQAHALRRRDDALEGF